ncbi:MAG: hypothetical protein [Bacteriophage sp.]|nr:MAG: hypothetical protein [Bacteriophage sp.]
MNYSERKAMLHIRDKEDHCIWTAYYDGVVINAMGHDVAGSQRKALYKAKRLYRSIGLSPGRMVYLAIDEDGRGAWYGTDKVTRLDKQDG